MGLVASDAALFTIQMASKDTLDVYYRVFKVHVDTIKAHCGNPGYHGAVYREHYEALMISKGHDTKEKLDAVDEAELKKMKPEALKSSAGAYPGCLFLMVADGRYKPVKKFLHEAFLAVKQQYPRDVLAVKRFMVDFIGADAGKPQRQQQQQPNNEPANAGVAFVSPDTKTKTFPVCHVCGKQHKGGYMKCRNITEDMRTGVDQMVKAGAFDDKSGVGDKSTKTKNVTTKFKKKGTFNAVVEEEDDGKETEVEEDELPFASIYFECSACPTL